MFRAHVTRFMTLASIVAMLSGCASSPRQVELAPISIGTADSAAFVTRLGADTMVIERFVIDSRRVEADVVLRVPTTSRTRYVLDLEPNGFIRALEATAIDPRTGASSPRQRWVRDAQHPDSLRVTTWRGGVDSTRTIAAEAAVVPFIDMVHFPYEIMLRRAKLAQQPHGPRPMLSGGRVQQFVIAAHPSSDSTTITHPNRGTMTVATDAEGAILALDAGATTRKLTVNRLSWSAVDPTQVASAWNALDAAGRSFGVLSGRATPTYTVAGATIKLDHGTPVKRGREIWGALVKYGEVWRTGANTATHITTDRDLVLDPSGAKLAMPAGTYTLFSIPDDNGGWLIVSRETGQAGTAYDSSKDLGRVRMTARPLDAVVETFTIRADPAGSGGELRLQWDKAERVVAFAVK